MKETVCEPKSNTEHLLWILTFEDDTAIPTILSM